ncbi:hypothetical protein K502DRAFT_369133 [Neoconidiobolus thromboides FSU 785]|nr:hypothetical protein K502DRAFT_369133 [Neoconidiobolus thromboides FSU 785]
MGFNGIVLSQGFSVFLSIISVIGIVFLSVVGRLHEIGFPAFTETVSSFDDPKAVAHSCYVAALIYVGVLIFSGFQVFLHSRKSQNALRL